MIRQGIARHTLIEVTPEGVIWDGNHGAAAAAQLGGSVTVRIVAASFAAQGPIAALAVGA